MKFHPDVLAVHAEFGGDLPAMQALYDRPDHLARIAELAAENERLKHDQTAYKSTIDYLRKRAEEAEAPSRTGAVKEAGAKLAKAVFGVDLVAHPRATNPVDAHETANVSDKPEGQQEPVAWALMSKTAGTLSTTIEKTVATKWKEQEALSGFYLAPLFTRPSEQAVTEAMVDKVLDAAGDYMGKQYGNTALHNPIDRERIKAAMEAGHD